VSASDTASRSARVLVVDDEPSVLDPIAYTLRKEGYEVAIATNGPDAIAAARSTKPDLVVLDVMLPGIDGLHVCRTLRSESTVPILLLSAKGEEIDRVVGLEMGADDYLGKPFAMRELLARIRAILRRAEMMQTSNRRGDSSGSQVSGHDPQSLPGPLEQAPGSAAIGKVIVGDLTIDRARRLATLGKSTLALRPKEFDLLHYLAQHPGIVHSRDSLLHKVWGYDFPMGTRTVDVHVRWLRQKIEDDPANPVRIETVRGVGYRLNPAP
jgi:two-component system alkaline phosphatase synthesis response regulator PhoP